MSETEVKGKNALDLLLGIDKTKIQRPTRRVELPRLTELAGAPVKFTCQALTFDELEEVQEISADKDGVVEQKKIQVFTVLMGVSDPDLKSSSLREAYGAATPKELIEQLLLPGEIAQLYSIISDLSGYGEKSIVEIKNA